MRRFLLAQDGTTLRVRGVWHLGGVVHDLTGRWPAIRRHDDGERYDRAAGHYAKVPSKQPVNICSRTPALTFMFHMRGPRLLSGEEMTAHRGAVSQSGGRFLSRIVHFIEFAMLRRRFWGGKRSGSVTAPNFIRMIALCEWYRYGDSNPGPVAENHVS